MLEHPAHGGHRLLLGVHVHVGVDVHGDLGAVVAGELLHDLGVDAVQGEQREVGVPELVEAPAVEPETCAVERPPAAERAGRHALAVVGGDDGRVLGLLQVALLRPAPLVRPSELGGLRLLLGKQRVARDLGQREQPHARLGLGLLEVPEAVEAVAHVHDAALEVDVAPRQAADLPAPEPHGDADEVGELAGHRRVDALDESGDLLGLHGALLARVHLGRVGRAARVLHENFLLNCLLEHERYVVVDLVDVGAAGRAAGERVTPEHGDVHVVKHRRRDGGEVRLTDVAARGLELPFLALERGGCDLLLGCADLEEPLAVLLEGVGRAALHLVVLKLLDEAPQGLLCLGEVHVGDAPGAGLVLAGARVEADGHAELPFAALGLWLVLLELDDGALAGDLGHGYSPSSAGT